MLPDDIEARTLGTLRSTPHSDLGFPMDSSIVKLLTIPKRPSLSVCNLGTTPFGPASEGSNLRFFRAQWLSGVAMPLSY